MKTTRQRPTRTRLTATLLLLAAILPLGGCFWTGHFVAPAYRRNSYDGMFFGSTDDQPSGIGKAQIERDGSDFYKFGSFGRVVAEDQARQASSQLLLKQQGGTRVGARFVVRSGKNLLAGVYETLIAFPLELIFLIIPQEVPWYYGVEVESWPLLPPTSGD